MFKDTCRKGKTIKSTEITVTKANVDMITDVSVGCCDEEEPMGGSWRGVGIVSSLDLVAVVQIFTLYLILTKQNMLLKTLNICIMHFSA